MPLPLFLGLIAAVILAAGLTIFAAQGEGHGHGVDLLVTLIQATAARRFGDQQQFGVLVSAAWSKRKTQGFVFYNDEDYLAYQEDDPSAGVTPLQFHLTQYEDDRENISANLALNWAVSNATELTFKGSYNRLYDQELSRALYFEAGTDEYDDDGALILTEPGVGYRLQV